MHCTHTFPSTITPITQLSPFTHQPWLPHHTCTSFTHSHKSSTQTLTSTKSCFPWLTFPSVFPLCVYLFTTWTVDSLSPDRLLPALLTPPAYWLSSLSAACPDPLLCHRSRICLLYVALDTTVWYLPVWPPLCFNKAASGSNYTASSLQKTSPPQIQRLYFGYPAKPWTP